MTADLKAEAQKVLAAYEKYESHRDAVPFAGAMEGLRKAVEMQAPAEGDGTAPDLAAVMAELIEEFAVFEPMVLLSQRDALKRARAALAAFKAQPKGMAEGTVLVARGLLKEARDNAEASCAESGVSHGRLEYRKELVQRLEAAMVANFAERPAKPIGVEVVGVVRPGGEDGPSVEWLLEGGLHAVAEGGETYLLVSHSPITNDDGHGEVVRVNHED